MIPEGSDAISPAPHHDIYSIEDLRQLVYSLKEATEYKKPVIVKVAAVHNIAAIASGALACSFYPHYMLPSPNALGCAAYASYTILALFPALLEVEERIRWKSLKSKI